MPIPRSLFEAVSACPSPILPSMILIAFLGLPSADSGAWAAATLTDGRAAPASDLRDISASGPRETRWTTQPTPYAGNPTNHQGRPAGSYDDGGRGRISGEILADETGRATIVVRDLKDTATAGHLVVTTGGEATRLAVDRGANGGARTITLSGLIAGAWNGFRVLWAMGSASPAKRDGFSVCRG